jgi:hypothetical protein
VLFPGIRSESGRKINMRSDRREPAISFHSHHVSLVQWTTRLRPVTRDPGSKPLGGLMWNRYSPVSDVSLHWWPWCDWSFLWPRLRRASSQTISGPSCRQCDNLTWSHTALLSRFHARCRSPGCWGGALWRACNLISFSPCLTGPVDYPFASRHKGPGFKTLGGLMWNQDSPVSVVSLHDFILKLFSSGVYRTYTGLLSNLIVKNPFFPGGWRLVPNINMWQIFVT